MIFLIADKDGDERGGESAGNEDFENQVWNPKRSKKNIEIFLGEKSCERSVADKPKEARSDNHQRKD